MSGDTVAGQPASRNAEEFRLGMGNWAAFRLPLDRIYAAAQHWKAIAGGVAKPWLCWNVDDDWCLVQQRLVAEVGWTPIVGSDPRVPRPRLLPESLYIDFNDGFGFPTLWMHFPLEFVFLFADRLAFWHSDLLIRIEKMRHLAEMFAQLRDGEMAAVQHPFELSKIFSKQNHRYWELVGCTTNAASRSQFDNGAGWWCNFSRHPNCPSEAERRRRARWYWDHGTGTMYWARHCGGKVVGIPARYVAEGHCTQIGNKQYERVSPNDPTRFLARDLRHNFELAEVCRSLGLEALLVEPSKS
jgi:hypothetical protein